MLDRKRRTEIRLSRLRLRAGPSLPNPENSAQIAGSGHVALTSTNVFSPCSENAVYRVSVANQMSTNLASVITACRKNMRELQPPRSYQITLQAVLKYASGNPIYVFRPFKIGYIMPSHTPAGIHSFSRKKIKNSVPHPHTERSSFC